MRVDKLLWFLRFAKTRSIAQAMVEAAHIRLNGRRLERAHASVKPGDVLVLPLPAGVRVIEIISLPLRRGPAREASKCYRVLDEHSPNCIGRELERPDFRGDPPQ